MTASLRLSTCPRVTPEFQPIKASSKTVKAKVYRISEFDGRLESFHHVIFIPSHSLLLSSDYQWQGSAWEYRKEIELLHVKGQKTFDQQRCKGIRWECIKIEFVKDLNISSEFEILIKQRYTLTVERKKVETKIQEISKQWFTLINDITKE